MPSLTLTLNHRYQSILEVISRCDEADDVVKYAYIAEKRFSDAVMRRNVDANAEHLEDVAGLDAVACGDGTSRYLNTPGDVVDAIFGMTVKVDEAGSLYVTEEGDARGAAERERLTRYARGFTQDLELMHAHIAMRGARASLTEKVRRCSCSWVITPLTHAPSAPCCVGCREESPPAIDKEAASRVVEKARRGHRHPCEQR